MSLILFDIKKKIESFEKNYQIQILHYLQQISYLKLNENENGIFINISLLKESDIEDLLEQISTIDKQRDELLLLECEKLKLSNSLSPSS